LALCPQFVFIDKKKRAAYGRTEEVATVLETLITITGGDLPSFLTHTLDEVRER